MHEHILLKLVSSELLIGRIDSLTDDIIVLEYPMLINFVDNMYNETSQVYVSSYNPFFKDNQFLTVKRKFVIFDSPVDNEYAKFYENFVKRKINKQKTKAYKDDTLQYLNDFEMNANNSSINWFRTCLIIHR